MNDLSRNKVVGKLSKNGPDSWPPEIKRFEAAVTNFKQLKLSRLSMFTGLIF